ncbi:hypothetical protein MSG28_009853, partial [Choristoneura fumiferana]
MADDVIKHSVHTLVFRSLKRSHDMFLANQGMLPPIDETAEKILRSVKARDSYGQVMAAVQKAQASQQQLGGQCTLTVRGPPPPPAAAATALAPRKPPTMPKPRWHAPWKLFRVISGHLGWVSSRHPYLFSCGEDRQVKCWDLEYNK